MKKNFLTALSGIGLVFAATVPASAQFNLPDNLVILQDWQFNDSAGTGTTNLINSAGTSSFDADIVTAETTGNGTLRAGTFGGSPFGTYAPATLPSSGTAYLVVDLASWGPALEGVAAQARFGFHHSVGSAGAASEMVTEFSFERTATGVNLALFTTGTGSTHPGRAAVSAIPVNSEDPIRFVMEYDIDALESRLFYSLGGGSFAQYGETGIVSSARAGAGTPGEMLRMSFFNGSDAAGNGMEIDRMFIAIPEPSTYVLVAGFGALGLALWSRRRKKIEA